MSEVTFSDRSYPTRRDDDFRIVLHVGPPKTGTTALQRMLQLRFGAPTPQPIWFPTPAALGPGHALLADVTMGRGRDSCNPEVFLDLINQARAGGCHTLVVSSENFSEVVAMGGPSVRAVLRGSAWQLVITLSPIAQRMLSNWQEDVKHGLSRTMVDSTDHILGRAGMTPEFVANIAAVLEPSGTTVIITSPRDEPEKIARNFAAAMDLPPLVAEGSKAVRANVGLGAIETDVLFRANSALSDRGLNPFPFGQYLTGQIFEDPAWRQFVPFEPIVSPLKWESRLRDVTRKTRKELEELQATKKITIIGNLDTLDDVDSMFNPQENSDKDAHTPAS